MKRNILFCIIILLVSVSGLKAQDTIDTNYYRYDNHFLRSGNLGVSNFETGEYIDGCPNGVGFTEMGRDSFRDYIFHDQNGYIGTISSGRFCPYMYYKLSEPKTRVYGIAIALDTIVNFTEGDSLTVTLCDAAGDHFVPLDSITIKGGEIGKRRWIEIPILRSDLDFTHWEGFEPYDNCIDTVLYRQVLEFYFNGFKEVDGAQLWWIMRLGTSNGSDFKPTLCKGPGTYVAYYDEHCVSGNAYNSWDYFFPIITPLPEWEEPSMTQVIPFPAEAPEPPAPEDPDPDNPGGDEGIDNIEIQNSEFEINIYPNPASGHSVVTCDAPILELTLRDINGRLIRTLRNCGTTTTLDTSTLTPGLYTLKITTPTGTTTRKLAIK